MAERNEVTVILSDEAMEFVKAKIATGEYASESDVIEHELEWARAEDEARRRCEQNEMIPALQELESTLRSTISAEKVLESLRRA